LTTNVIVFGATENDFYIRRLINSNLEIVNKIEILHVGGNTTITTSKKYSCIVALSAGQDTGGPSSSVNIPGIVYICNNRKYGREPDMSVTMGYALNCEAGTTISLRAYYNHCGIVIGIL